MNKKESLFALQTWLIAGFLVLLSPGCAINPVSGKQDFVLMSEAQEMSLGQSYHPEIIKQYPLYKDEALQSYVAELGAKLAEKSHRGELVYRFHVLDSPIINAFAVPGGYIYITRGLLAYMQSEAELAAVLGHEIGHITARHTVRQYTMGQLANMALLAGMLFIPELAQPGLSELSQLLAVGIIRGYGREYELESDRLGAEYLAKIGYKPQAMMGVLKVLKNQEIFETERAKAEGREPQVYHGVFSTHPDNDTRLQEVVEHADKLLTSASKETDPQLFLQHIDGLNYGHSADEGVFRNDMFYHASLGFAFPLPKGWHFYNHPDHLAMVAPDGEASLSLHMEPLSKKNITPEQFMRQHLDLDKGMSGKAFTTEDSLDGAWALLDKKSYHAVIFLDNNAYIITGEAKNAKNLPNYQSIFQQTARGFHSLREDEQENARPLRLKVIQADKDTRFAELAKTSPLQGFAEENLRLLNGFFPTGEPESGQYLRIIE